VTKKIDGSSPLPKDHAMERAEIDATSPDMVEGYLRPGGGMVTVGLPLAMANVIRVERKRVDAIKKLISETWATLPRCGTRECGAVATHTRFDATGNPWPTCADHATIGGMLGDDEPVERPYVAKLQEALAILEAPIDYPAWAGSSRAFEEQPR